MQLRVIKFHFCLPPDVIKNIFSFLSCIPHHFPGHGYGSRLARIIYLKQITGVSYKNTFAVFAHLDATWRTAEFCQDLCISCAGLGYPKVIALLERSEVINFCTVRCDGIVAYRSTVYG